MGQALEGYKGVHHIGIVSHTATIPCLHCKAPVLTICSGIQIVITEFQYTCLACGESGFYTGISASIPEKGK